MSSLVSFLSSPLSVPTTKATIMLTMGHVPTTASISLTHPTSFPHPHTRAAARKTSTQNSRLMVGPERLLASLTILRRRMARANHARRPAGQSAVGLRAHSGELQRWTSQRVLRTRRRLSGRGAQTGNQKMFRHRVTPRQALVSVRQTGSRDSKILRGQCHRHLRIRRVLPRWARAHLARVARVEP